MIFCNISPMRATPGTWPFRGCLLDRLPCLLLPPPSYWPSPCWWKPRWPILFSGD